ncbi:MarR family winged helix-turn-helix transcriptional regulator [Clostridium mediterraneense]|uniref:MarR family winged helix-turn-helix transcriptional regulator n=1 Tax=Clostridium mediterraneense TaxID=1805472 RepID=UPI0008342DE6|nr:MarR family transcriptional regulator [Clostridium mediterraneense]
MKIKEEERHDYIISFRKVKKFYKKFIDNEMKKFDLSQNEIEIITYLNRNPEKNTAKDIVEYLGISKGMISRNIDILLSKGIIEPKKDNIDKRIIRLYITKESEELINEIEESIFNFLGSLLENIEEEKFKIFKEVLNSLTNNLEELEKK